MNYFVHKTKFIKIIKACIKVIPYLLYKAASYQHFNWMILKTTFQIKNGLVLFEFTKASHKLFHAASIRDTNLKLTFARSDSCKSYRFFGWEQWSYGYGRRLMLLRLWVWIPVTNTEWNFFNVICCKNSIIYLKIPKISKEWGREWPILKKYFLIPWFFGLYFTLLNQNRPNITYLNKPTLA